MEDRKPILEAMLAAHLYDFDDYLPKVFKAEHGYGITCRLPEKPYKKWIARVMGNQKFIDKYVSNVTPILMPFLRQHRDFLRLTINDDGITFQCYGDACEVHMPNGSTEYVCHNIDSALQAMILFMALSVYLPDLYCIFNMFETGQLDPEKWPPLERNIFPGSINIKPKPEEMMPQQKWDPDTP